MVVDLVCACYRVGPPWAAGQSHRQTVHRGWFTAGHGTSALVGLVGQRADVPGARRAQVGRLPDARVYEPLIGAGFIRTSDAETVRPRHVRVPLICWGYLSLKRST